MKYSAVLLLSAVMLPAQSVYEIRGTVSEPGLGGIAGATVEVYAQNFVNPPAQTAFTDGRGEFVIRTATPGLYSLIASHEGYGPTPDQFTIGTTVDPDHPRANVNISLVRLGSITGRVVDADTREPVEGSRRPSIWRWTL